MTLSDPSKAAFGCSWIWGGKRFPLWILTAESVRDLSGLLHYDMPNPTCNRHAAGAVTCYHMLGHFRCNVTRSNMSFSCSFLVFNCRRDIATNLWVTHGIREWNSGWMRCNQVLWLHYTLVYFKCETVWGIILFKPWYQYSSRRLSNRVISDRVKIKDQDWNFCKMGNKNWIHWDFKDVRATASCVILDIPSDAKALHLNNSTRRRDILQGRTEGVIIPWSLS